MSGAQTMTEAHLRRAVENIRRRPFGDQALAELAAWLESHWENLDDLGQHSVTVLLQGAAGDFPETVRRLCRGNGPEDGPESRVQSPEPE